MHKRTFLKTIFFGAVSFVSLLHARNSWAKRYAVALNKLPALEKIGGSVTILLDERPVLLVRLSDKEIRAFHGLCTHQSCPVSYKKSQISCECHGSHFDMNGKVKTGPAVKPLPKIPIEIRDKKLVVG